MIQTLIKRFLALSLVLSLSSNGFSQQKFEKEFRIQKSEVPENAIHFVDSMLLDTKIKWYKETGYDKISFEAKTKYKGEKFSIEFAENGWFEDVEIEIDAKKIPLTIAKKIEEILTNVHAKYSFEKVQVQYSGDPVTVLNYFQNKSSKSDLVIHYEIVIATQIDGTYVMFEYLFSDIGEFLQKSEIILKMTDNIEY